MIAVIAVAVKACFLKEMSVLNIIQILINFDQRDTIESDRPRTKEGFSRPTEQFTD